MKNITILTPIQNEIENIPSFIQAIENEVSKIDGYSFAHIFVDNHSTDGSSELVIEQIELTPHVGLIINQKDYGHHRSVFNALKTLDTDAVILISADFQEPTCLIPKFVEHWANGHKIVGGIKLSDASKSPVSLLRKLYYTLMKNISESTHTPGFIGFGLYDKKVIDEFKKVQDAEPYLRGLPADLGFEIMGVEYHQPQRSAGKSKFNFLKLLDMSILGITSQSKVPIRIATVIGLLSSIASFGIGIIYLIIKLIYWDQINFGLAPLIIFVTFAFSLQFLFIGLVGEYISKISRDILKRPLAIEEKRLNVPPNKNI
jgi:glycosyltransferase involved in cell wall biosynthesis